MPERMPTTLPDKTAIAELPLFEGLARQAVTVVATEAEAEAAYRALAAQAEIGFDTESKPTFSRGEASTGPHLLQFCTREHAWLFQSCRPETLAPALALIEAESPAKVGFGLRGDLAQLARRFEVTARGIVDLGQVLRAYGFSQEVGAKTAIALLFGQRLAKSKQVGTSNWAATQLADRQVLYAANDAYAALSVKHRLADFEPPKAQAARKGQRPRSRVRDVHVDDVPVLATLSGQPEALLAAEVRAAQAARTPWVVAVREGAVVGFARAHAQEAGTTLSLVPANTQTALARQLVQALFTRLARQGCPEVQLGAASSAHAALYARLGLEALDNGRWRKVFAAA